jgi:hypothetical protein
VKGGVEVKLHSFLTVALVRDESLASHHDRITLEKILVGIKKEAG